MACPILLNTLGFAPDILRVMEKWLTCPCDSPTLFPLPGSTNLQSLKPGRSNGHALNRGQGPIPAPRTSLFFHFFHRSFQPLFQNTHIDASAMPRPVPCDGNAEKELLMWNTRKPEQRQERGLGGRNLGFRVRPI